MKITVKTRPLNFRLSTMWTPNEKVEVLVRATSLENKGIAAGIFAAGGASVAPSTARELLTSQAWVSSADVPRDGTVGPFFLENTVRDCLQ